MAEAQTNFCSGNSSNIEKQKDDQTVLGVPECAVCLQPCIYPARLPCSHIFCFLCVKGVANQSKRCPMCRHEIPPDYLEHPQLIDLDETIQKETINTTSTSDNHSHEEYQWFYEGRNGWWQYDERTSIELETAFKKEEATCELLIAGFLYVADFTTMLQYRRNDNSRKRKIKRDLYNAPKKGVAGLRLNHNQNRTDQSEQLQHHNQVQQQQHQLQQHQFFNSNRGILRTERSASPSNDNTGGESTSPIPPSNTPQTPAGGTLSGDATPLAQTRLLDHRPDSLHQVLEQMRSLVLRENLSSHNSQDLQDSIDDGSFSDNSTFPWLQSSFASTQNYSTEEEENS
ncbi:E3 ubiquitin-protein ligase rnf146-like isoform X1 [Trichogramma pretiosum]|uniref:E3 ubiquitin-protein ligase rnf146-like isoform X1 n=1 Tax=Trichogramma pretiosum TaxID=7493 RepID=UPI0006C9843A|nr:E3 ubiquitin-protein ligase rnf146-like isoform X1 [Trichogramma pretiosum]